MRDSVTVTQEAHNLKTLGANPGSATKFRAYGFVRPQIKGSNLMEFYHRRVSDWWIRQNYGTPVLEQLKHSPMVRIGNIIIGEDADATQVWKFPGIDKF